MLLIKQPYFQLGVLVLVYLLYLAMLGEEIAISLFFFLLICAVYIVLYERQYKFISWLRAALYAVIIYTIYYILRSLPTDIHVVRLFEPDISGLDLVRRIYVDFFLGFIVYRPTSLSFNI